MEQYVSVLANCEIYTEPKFNLLPLSFTVCGRAETLNSASLFVCRGLLPGAVSKGSEMYRIQTDSLSTHS